MESFRSAEAFKYIWLNWRIMGLNPLPHHRRLYKIYAIFINLTIPVIPPLQQLIQVFFADSIEGILRNLSISLEWTCGCFKHFVLISWHKRLRDGHRFLDRLDARARRHDEELEIMQSIVRNCRRFYYGYNLTFWTTLAFFTINGAINRRIIFEGYFPWDWTASLNKYLLAFGYQLVAASFQLVLNLTSDSYALCYVYVMLGHIQMLGMRISRIGYDGAVSQEGNYVELIECVHDHRSILLFFDHIRPVISRTILIQFIVTAFSLCLAAFYFIFYNSNLGMLLTTIMYLSVLFVQVTPVCYYVNTLMVASDNLTTDLYSCNWMDQDLRFRKNLVIFMQRSQKTTTIVAANLAPVTLQTCFKILRFSFSMFTVLTQI